MTSTPGEGGLGRRLGIALAAVALAAGSALARASPPAKSTKPAVDLGLLEFLGSADPETGSAQADDGGWMAYLSQLKLGKSAAKPSQPPASAKPAAAPAKATPSAGPSDD
jgi:hypothetical protein